MVNYWSKLNQFLLPEHCLLCQQSAAIQAATCICHNCCLDLPWLDTQQCCQRCALPLVKRPGSSPLCGQCQQKPPAFDACHCLFHYQSPVDTLISRFKFNQQLSYSRLFGQLLAQQITDRYQRIALPDAIIPVPLHNKRLRERGFNQAQELARICAKALDIPLNTRHCRRDKHTAHQPGLSRLERRRNLRSAFSSKPFSPNSRIAIVDDVMTTGTTFNELALCLKKAGCQEVHLWCIARVHSP